MAEVSTFELSDPFALPEDAELTHRVHKPKWWYAKQLRMAGVSAAEIAESLGYENAETAEVVISKANRASRKVYEESLKEIVDLELERLDALQVICWQAIQKGDLKLIMTVLAIMSMRMKLLGTEKKPSGDSAETTNNTAIFIGGDSDQYKEALRQARELVKQTERGTS